MKVKRKMYSFRLKDETAETIQRLAEWNQISQSDLIALAINDFAAKSAPSCSWCGKPASGNLVGSLGRLFYCESHQCVARRLAELMPGNYNAEESEGAPKKAAGDNDELLFHDILF